MWIFNNYKTLKILWYEKGETKTNSTEIWLPEKQKGVQLFIKGKTISIHLKASSRLAKKN